MYKIAFLLCVVMLSGCARQKQKADLILFNGTIYTVDSTFSTCEAMAISNGTIMACGSTANITEDYESNERVDLRKKPVYPGFIDAHCHFLGYGLGLMRLNLTGTTSFKEVITKTAAFVQAEKGADDDGKVRLPGADTSWIIGRGWDQNDWAEKTYPDKKPLDSLFPNRPVMLVRIDGHAALVNSVALKKAGITAQTSMAGGEVMVRNGQPTGVLIDNAVDLVKKAIPAIPASLKENGLALAEKNCLAMGITTVDDAGLMKEDIEVIDKMHRDKTLNMRVYAMLSDSQPNFDHFLKAGPLKTERLNVRCFKLYADGAMGSRGACLLQDYTDRKGSRGFLLNSREHFLRRSKEAIANGFQVATHCIGDSAYRLLLNVYNEAGADKKHRWRIEHAQFTHPDDIKRSSGIIPSVQPTHATSDMYWVKERLGKERTRYAYAYKALLKAAGVVALGTDFPVEHISPFRTFYAAVTRTDSTGFPPGGFELQSALTREETMRGMTSWAAYSNFEENEKGSLMPGKFADFIILDRDLMKIPAGEILKTAVEATYINGKRVYVKE
jgi:predicted amidohydrolase YtcJ